MKIAIVNNNERLSPVFDVASQAILLEINGGKESVEKVLSLTNRDATAKIDILKEQNVNTLICGAISRYVQEYAESKDISVYAFIAGNIQEVLNAWKDGTLFMKQSFSMPGCRFRQGMNCNRKGNRRRWNDNEFNNNK